jgi:two-component system invasion response regulator UvrY
MSGTDESLPSKIRLLIATDNSLDGDLLSVRFCESTDFCAVCMLPDIKSLAAASRECPPNCLLLNGHLLGPDADSNLAAWERELHGIPLMLLDDATNYGHLAAVLESSSIGYFTRAASFTELIDGVRKLVTGERTFCSVANLQLEHSAAGWRFRQDQAHSPFDRLTRRELEIARLIAGGNSVLQCAQTLNLSPSTIDNHKTSFMKKLGVHKAHDLTLLAVHEGIIQF